MDGGSNQRKAMPNRLYPTLLASTGYKAPKKDRNGNLTFIGAMAMMPKLTRRDLCGEKGAERPSNHQGGPNSVQTVGGQLNPTFCEWYMGWPLGSTALAPLATDGCRSWLQQHGVD